MFCVMNMGTDRASAQTRHRSSDRNDGLPPHVRRAQLQKFLNIRHGFTLPDNAVGRAAAYQMCNLLAQEPDAVPHIGHWLDLNCRWMAKAERDDLLRRVARHHAKRMAREDTPMTFDRGAEIQKIVKASGGLLPLCKAMTDDQSLCNKISEAEFTALVTEEARKLYPDARPDTAFSKFFSDPQNDTVRRAHQMIGQHPDHAFDYLKNEPLQKAAMRPPESDPVASLTPVFVGGEEGNRTRSSPARLKTPPDIGRVGRAAIDQLYDLTREQLRQRNLSTEHFARVFAEIYTDPSNAQLATQERLEKRPGGPGRMAT